MDYEFVNGNEGLNTCPFCKSCAEGVAKESGKYFVVCDNPYCLATGPRCDTIEEAIKFWNQATKGD